MTPPKEENGVFKIRLPSRKSLALILAGTVLGGSGFKALDSNVVRALAGLAPVAKPEESGLLKADHDSIIELRAALGAIQKDIDRLYLVLGVARKPSWADRDRGMVAESHR